MSREHLGWDQRHRKFQSFDREILSDKGKRTECWYIKKSRLREIDSLERSCLKARTWAHKRAKNYRDRFLQKLKDENLRRFHGAYQGDYKYRACVYFRPYIPDGGGILPLIPYDRDKESLELEFLDRPDNRMDDQIGPLRQDLMDEYEHSQTMERYWQYTAWHIWKIFTKTLTRDLWNSWEGNNNPSAIATVTLNSRTYIISNSQGSGYIVHEPWEIYDMNKEKHFDVWK